MLFVFDLGGTIIDHGCRSPDIALRKVFSTYITLDDPSVYDHMGMAKKEHIELICEKYNLKDTIRKEILQKFPAILDKVLITKEIEGARDVVEDALSKGHRVAFSTGYPLPIVHRIVDDNPWLEGHCVTNHQISYRGRPYPYMIYDCMRDSGVKSIKEVVKVGDTPMDMLAAKNAGCHGVLVVSSSALVGLTKKEWDGRKDKAVLRDKLTETAFSSTGKFGFRSVDSLSVLLKLISYYDFLNGWGT